ncbi:MAG: MBL fold metallo-hydrolase [Eubacteriales bacterium]|nr:MBL fold metallo-hydrolase [Eubacteriales bacterium]
MQINIETVDVGMNCYLVVNEDKNELVVVDPGTMPEKIIAAIGSRKPVAVLLTHGHYDHIGAVDAVCEKYGIPLYMHAGDFGKLTDPHANVGDQFGHLVTVRTKPRAVEDGQTLRLAGMDITVWHTPGHSAGGVCYLLPGNAGVLCGDTLFDGGYGRYDFDDGDFQALKQSLKRLLFMTPRVPAYPGHGGPTHAGRDA